MSFDKSRVVYSTDTPHGNLLGLGNHIMIFNAAYSWCLDNSLPFAVDKNAHPVFQNMALPKAEAPQGKCYAITHLTDIRPNGLPFQLHQWEGSEDTNGASIMAYAHNLRQIKDALNVPDISVDGCIMHYRMFNECPQHNIGLPYYMNALKQIESSTVYVMYGFDNYDIKAEQTRQNVRYLINHLSKIYPDKRFIDMQAVPEYKRDDPKDECALHWYLCVNAPELITANSTFSFSAAMFRGDKRTVMPKYAACYKNFDVSDYKKILKDIRLINRNVIVSAWYDVGKGRRDNDKRIDAIRTLFERVNNADIVMFTDDVDYFRNLHIDTIAVSELSHVHILKVPFSQLPTHKYRDHFDKCGYVISNHNSRGSSTDVRVVQFSKPWFVLLASEYNKRRYDRIAWIDAGLFKNEFITTSDIFPILERHSINKILLTSHSVDTASLQGHIYYPIIEGGFFIYPSADFVGVLSSLYASVLDETIKLHMLIHDGDEEVMRLCVNFTSELFVCIHNKGTRVQDWYRSISEFSETSVVFRDTDYGNINIHPPTINIEPLKQWFAEYKSGRRILSDPLRFV